MSILDEFLNKKLFDKILNESDLDRYNQDRMNNAYKKSTEKEGFNGQIVDTGGSPPNPANITQEGPNESTDEEIDFQKFLNKYKNSNNIEDIKILKK
jgi:hypothetical protein